MIKSLVWINNKYEDGKCVDVWTEGYETKKQKIKNIELDICFKCGSDNKTLYDGLGCTENCRKSKYVSDDHFCRIFFMVFQNLIVKNLMIAVNAIKMK